MASIPLFFHDNLPAAGHTIELEESTARHIVQVLRMQVGENIELTDGKGTSADAVIDSTGKKKCGVRIDHIATHEAPKARLHLGIGFTKNSARNEWLLEKATELGVSSIIPLIAHRTEREKSKTERWHNILVSAMLQSQQYFLPELAEPTALKTVLEKYLASQRFIAHCIDNVDKKPIAETLKASLETVILIGPEGDFTEDEVNLCFSYGFSGVSLGKQRLRTETAAMAACAYFNLINDEKV